MITILLSCGWLAYTFLQIVSFGMQAILSPEEQVRYQFIKLASTSAPWFIYLLVVTVLFVNFLVRSVDESIVEHRKRIDAQFQTQLSARESAWNTERVQINFKLDAVEKEVEIERARNARAELKGELQNCVMTPVRDWDWFTKQQQLDVKLLVTLKLNFANHRPTPVTIKNFSLAIGMFNGRNYVAPYPLDEKILQSDDNLYVGKELPNLVDIIESRSEAKQGGGFDGYLMFEVPGFQLADVDELNEKSAISVTITDALYDKHSIEIWGPINPHKRIVVREIPERERTQQYEEC